MKHASPLHHDPNRLACAYHPKRPDAHYTQCSCPSRRSTLIAERMLADAVPAPTLPHVVIIHHEWAGQKTTLYFRTQSAARAYCQERRMAGQDAFTFLTAEAKRLGLL